MAIGRILGGVYDRAHLLSDAKRNDVLELEEIVRYGVDSFADPDYVTLYGLAPPEAYARGIRLLARTAVECTRDALAQRIAEDVAAVAMGAPGSVVLDPFAGSANTLYWLARRLCARRAIGFELDARVFEATRRNLALVGFDAELAHTGHETGLRELRIAGDELLVVFLAPPWGDALDPVTGLDLRRTQPPVAAIVDLLASLFAGRSLLVAIQIHETAVAASIDELRSRCEWSALTIYDIDPAGRNHGLLVGCLGWTPAVTARAH